MKDHTNIGRNSLVESGYAIIIISRPAIMGNQCIIIIAIIAQNCRYLEESYMG